MTLVFFGHIITVWRLHFENFVAGGLGHIGIAYFRSIIFLTQLEQQVLDVGIYLLLASNFIPVRFGSGFTKKESLRIYHRILMPEIYLASRSEGWLVKSGYCTALLGALTDSLLK